MTGFCFNPAPTVWTTVKLSVPTESGFESQSFRARFLILPQSEREAIARDGGKAAMERVWTGWEEIADVDGKAIPFSEAMRSEFLEFDYVLTALASAYAKASMGLETKN